MVKFLKLTPGYRVIECDDIVNDDEFQSREMVVYSLGQTQVWEHKEYRLLMYVEKDDSDLFHNSVASFLYEKLKSSNYENKPINGRVFITNANDEQEIDFTWDDFDYIWKKICEKWWTPNKHPFLDRV